MARFKMVVQLNTGLYVDGKFDSQSGFTEAEAFIAAVVKKRRTAGASSVDGVAVGPDGAAVSLA
jgi:hypothetical protein